MAAYERSKVLKPRFDLVRESSEWFKVTDGRGDDGGDFVVANYPSEQSARRYLNNLKVEHNGGRVAQARCEHGPCDFPRLTEPDQTPPDDLRRVVLCDAHAAEVNARQEARARRAVS